MILTDLQTNLLKRGAGSARGVIVLNDDMARWHMEHAALRPLVDNGLVEISGGPRLPGPPRPRNYAITDAGRSALTNGERGNG